MVKVREQLSKVENKPVAVLSEVGLATASVKVREESVMVKVGEASVAVPSTSDTRTPSLQL